MRITSLPTTIAVDTHLIPNLKPSGALFTTDAIAGSKLKNCNLGSAAMKQHFDTPQIVEITTAIATYNMVARILVPLGVGT